MFEFMKQQNLADMRGLTCDSRAPGRGLMLWTFTDYAMFRYMVTDESRHIWHIYMQQNQFEMALHYCGDNAAQKSQVLLRQAHNCLSKRQYEKAAQLYAQTEASFEEVALKFMQVKQEDALQTFLMEVRVTLAINFV